MAVHLVVGLLLLQDPALIDRHLSELWAERRVKPAPRAPDAEFLRRVTLDLAGTVPSVDEARTPPADRAALVDRLLASDAFARSWAQRLARSLVGWPTDEKLARVDHDGFASWLRERLAADAPWSELAREMVSATGNLSGGPISFVHQFAAYDGDAPRLRTDDLAGKVAEEFLGVRLRCAQCHDHPFDRWTRDDHASMTAFFRRTGFAKRQAIERLERPVDAREPRYLDGSAGKDDPSDLAERLARDPQFARAFVNRAWALMFGRGLVEPWNDFAPARKAVSPALLDELAAAWAKGGFRVRALVRAIALSDAYGRSSAGQEAVALAVFACARVRPLTPDQLFAAIDRATGLSEVEPERATLARLGAKSDDVRRWFVDLCVRTSDATAAHAPSRYTANAQQTLHMMMIDSPIWAGLRARAKAGRVAVDELYLATLARPPAAAERERAARLEIVDLYWSLVNCDEFVFNH